MRGSHRSTGESGNSVRATLVRGLDLKTRTENIHTFAEVGEICAVIAKGGSTDSDSLLGGGRRVVASVLVIVT